MAIVITILAFTGLFLIWRSSMRLTSYIGALEKGLPPDTLAGIQVAHSKRESFFF